MNVDDPRSIGPEVNPPVAQKRPLVSLILTTRDRPDFFPVALACCRQQRYPSCEMIVIDDGSRFPISRRLAADAGFVLIQPEENTPLGTKLNLGCDAAWGEICMKIDDDDWYGPDYVETMVDQLETSVDIALSAALLVAVSFLLFDLDRWELRRAKDAQYAGGTLCFRREDWQATPFRPLSNWEDVNFYHDQIKSGTRPLAIRTPESYLAIRHPGKGPNRGHTWISTPDAPTVEEHLRDRPLHERMPELLLPPWALSAYSNLRHRFSHTAAASDGMITDLGLVAATRPLDALR